MFWRRKFDVLSCKWSLTHSRSKPFSIKIDHIKSRHTAHVKIVCVPTQYTNQDCLTNVILIIEYFVMLTRIGKFQAWSAFNTVDTLRITVSSGMTNKRN